ncbi:MAG: hypothetical protein AB7J86_40390 [Vulcanimicrobiota bacterium]
MKTGKSIEDNDEAKRGNSHGCGWNHDTEMVRPLMTPGHRAKRLKSLRGFTDAKSVLASSVQSRVGEYIIGTYQNAATEGPRTLIVTSQALHADNGEEICRFAAIQDVDLPDGDDWKTEMAVPLSIRTQHGTKQLWLDPQAASAFYTFLLYTKDDVARTVSIRLSIETINDLETRRPKGVSRSQLIEEWLRERLNGGEAE